MTKSGQVMNPRWPRWAPILYLIKKKKENVINVNDQHIIQGKLFMSDNGKLSVMHCMHE